MEFVLVLSFMINVCNFLYFQQHLTMYFFGKILEINVENFFGYLILKISKSKSLTRRVFVEEN